LGNPSRNGGIWHVDAQAAFAAYTEVMSARGFLIFTVILAVVILVGALALIFLPSPQKGEPAAPQATTTPGTSTAPLDTQVQVTAPQENATVGHTFDIVGQAPGNWSFEAQFPMQVRDADDNLIGTATGQMQGDWQTTALVPFKAIMRIDASFEGEANLILLKDNPSGLPENFDEVTIPIVVK